MVGKLSFMKSHSECKFSLDIQPDFRESYSIDGLGASPINQIKQMPLSPSISTKMGSNMETRNTNQRATDIPKEFRIESFRSLKDKLGVQDKSVERLSLPRIIEAAKKSAPDILEKVEKYYDQTGWLLAAAEVARRIPTVKALERAEQYFAKGEFYRSAAEVAEKIGTPEALQRAKGYRSKIC
jgi:hypothetical protein